jgi:transposase-like protein
VRRKWRRQVGQGDQAARAGRVRAPVAKRGRAGADRLVSKRQRRADKPEENEKSESHSSHLRDDSLRLKPARALDGSCLTSALLSNHINFIANAGAGMRG